MNKHIVILVLIFCSCKNLDVNHNSTIKVDTRLQQQKNTIVGKKLDLIKNIVGESSNISNKFMLIYNGFDCRSCINSGYRMVNKIDSLAGLQMCYVIATSTSVARDQLDNNYINFVFYDEHDLIRRELKYIYTPVILKLNSNNIISDLYFPGKNGNPTVEENFFDLQNK